MLRPASSITHVHSTGDMLSGGIVARAVGIVESSMAKNVSLLAVSVMMPLHITPEYSIEASLG